MLLITDITSNFVHLSQRTLCLRVGRYLYDGMALTNQEVIVSCDLIEKKTIMHTWMTIFKIMGNVFWLTCVNISAGSHLPGAAEVIMYPYPQRIFMGFCDGPGNPRVTARNGICIHVAVNQVIKSASDMKRDHYPKFLLCVLIENCIFYFSNQWFMYYSQRQMNHF